MEIIKYIYSISHSFPKHETYCLSNQLRRSAISIPSNISEGFNRQHNNEYIQFLYISLGSCAELETQIEIAYELNYIDNKIREKIQNLITYESKMLTNLIKTIRTR